MGTLAFPQIPNRRAYGGSSLSKFVSRAGLPVLGASKLYDYAMARYGRKRTRSGKFKLKGYFRSSRSTARRSGMTSGRGLTFEHDRQRIYRKKSMPRFKKRRWKRFVKKVKYIGETNLGSRTVVFNTAYGFTVNTAGQQIVTDVCLYPCQSSSVRHNDLNNLSRLESTASTTNVNLDSTTKVFFHSGILDLTVRNTSFITGDPPEPNVADPDCTLELDVYEMTSKFAGDDSARTYSRWIDFFTQADAETDQITNSTLLPAGNTPSSLAISSRGATPWDLPSALSFYKLKILKKTKFFLRSGQTMTYQMRDPKRRVTTRYNMNTHEGLNFRGWTKCVFMIAKPIPGVTVGSLPGDTQAQITVGATRKYLYRVEGISDNRDLHVAQ